MSLIELDLCIDRKTLRNYVYEHQDKFQEYFEWVPIKVNESRAWKQLKIQPCELEEVQGLHNKLKSFFSNEKINCYFYILEKNHSIGTHSDPTTLCSINILLSDRNAPIIIDNKKYFYNTALLDTSREHSVPSSDNDRVMLKFSFTKTSFEVAKERLCLLKK